MGTIADNILALSDGLPPHVSVVAVSKTRSINEILEAYEAGQRIFGENKVQELLSKAGSLPGDIRWHLIGHLQTNKVKHVVTVASMIESVDSLRLLSLINDEAIKHGKITECLLQVHIASEETKFGFDMAEISDTDWRSVTRAMKGIRICGLMGMASLTDDMSVVRNEFRSLFSLFLTVQERWFSDSSWFREISMGMSGDWEIAVEEGSTMIRIGTLIFGERIKK